MTLLLLQNNWMLKKLRQVQCFTRPIYHLIRYSPKLKHIIVSEQVEKLTREFNIHYIACIGSFIYFLSTIVDLGFAVHKLAKFSSNSGKVTF